MDLHYCRPILLAVFPILAIVGILLVALPTKDMEEPPKNMYGIILDAGSSRTSMYIYKWPADKQNGTGIVTQHKECHMKGGGISSYAGHPGGAARSLEPCLEQAVKEIPKFRQHLTPVYLGATAGMRLLNMVNTTESDRILEEVGNKLRTYPFHFCEAAILSGQEEGAFGWVTVNYLLENFIKYGFVGRWENPSRGTVGAMDLGGASTQITFETSERVEDKNDVMELRLYGQDYRLYTHSFLCYGQDQFLRRLLAQLITTQGVGSRLSHPCYPAHFNVSIKLGKDVFNSPCTDKYTPSPFDPELSITVEGTGDYKHCLGNVSALFSFDCSYSKCSFDGVFQPNVTGSFMAFAAYYYSHTLLEKATGIAVTSPSRMEEAIRAVCNMSSFELKQKVQGDGKHLKNGCAVANFLQVLLMKGYRFDELSLPRISFTKKAGGASVSWALGYMLSLSNQLPAESIELKKALLPGAWASILFIFILLLLIVPGYLLLKTYQRKKAGGATI